MASAATHLLRLGRAGRALALHDVLTAEQVADLPWPARGAYRIARLGSRPRNGDLAAAQSLPEQAENPPLARGQAAKHPVLRGRIATAKHSERGGSAGPDFPPGDRTDRLENR